MRCPICGVENPNNYIYCSRCGTALQVFYTTQYPQIQSTANTQDRKTMTTSLSKRGPKELTIRKILVLVIVIIVIVSSLAALYVISVFNSFMQSPHGFNLDTFLVTSNSTEWKATFDSADGTQSPSDFIYPSDWYNLSFIYITIFKPDGSLGLATKRVSDMVSGQSHNGVRFFDLHDIGFLDNGDYFTFDKDIYPSSSSVTIEGHGGTWSWSMSFGLYSWF